MMRHSVFRVLLILAPAVITGGMIHIVMTAMQAEPLVALFLSVVVGLLTLVLAFVLVRSDTLRTRRNKD